MNANYMLLRLFHYDKCSSILLWFIFILGVLVGTLINMMRNIRRFTQTVKDVYTNISTDVECKMILCVRTDLKMNKGKICSQCCHACLSIYEKIINRNKSIRESTCVNKKNNLTYYDIWKRTGQKKVVLKIGSLEEMYEVQRRAQKENLMSSIIIDAGRTQIDPNTPTVIAIEPAPDEIVNKVTGDLKLL